LKLNGLKTIWGVRYTQKDSTRMGTISQDETPRVGRKTRQVEKVVLGVELLPGPYRGDLSSS